MIGVRGVVEQVERMYRGTSDDPEFATVLRVITPSDDDALAELIELDGRVRMSLGREAALDRYLRAVPDLKRRELPLDAAIDIALRSLSASSRPTPEAVRKLSSQHPDLTPAIAEAVDLSAAVVSTTGVGAFVTTPPVRDLPCEFGPRMPAGRLRYELIQLLGSGSGGEVFLAIDRLLSEPDQPARVAVKVLGSSIKGLRARRLLAEEATKARRVVHANVVRTLDRGTAESDEDYIVYEYVDGGDLDTWFAARGKWLSPREAVGIVAKAAHGVHAAHLAGLLHCDLKPSNILISASGEPKVSDFGIAVRERDVVHSVGGRPIGNVAFISPEQYRGEDGCLSAPSDVYALGGILFYLLTGQLPNGASIEEVAARHALAPGHAAPPSPRAVRDQTDADLDAVVQRVMAPIPSERYSSAAGFAEDLQRWLEHRPLSWRRPTFWRVTTLAMRRRPGLAAALALLAAAVLSAGVLTGYWASVAQARRQEATQANERMNIVREHVTNTYDAFRQLRRQNIGEDLLPIILVFEWLYGSDVIGGESGTTRLWNDRIQHIQHLVDDSTRNGRADELSSLFWQGVLGYWYVTDGSYDQAIEVISDNAARWEKRGLQNDPLPRQLRMLLDVATVQQISLALSQRPLTESEQGRLKLAKEHIDGEAEVFAGRARKSPMRLCVLKAKIVLYGPKMFNDAKIVRAAKREIDFVGE